MIAYGGYAIILYHRRDAILSVIPWRSSQLFHVLYEGASNGGGVLT
jgi:hypothetical protein